MFKQAFLLFDLDGDGCIDHNDLRGTLVSLGENIDEQLIKTMLSEVSSILSSFFHSNAHPFHSNTNADYSVFLY